MTTFLRHLPALVVLVVTAGLVGSLAAIGSITGHTALVVFLAVLAAVGTAIGVKIGATAAGKTPPKSTTP